MKEFHDPIAGIDDNVGKQIVDILIAPNNVWEKGEKISHCVTE